MPELSLGIDFGTTTTLVSFREPGMLPQVLPIGQGNRTYMPSAMSFLTNADHTVKVLVGEDALRASGGTDVITSVKRCLNCDGRRCFREDGPGHHLDGPILPISVSHWRCHNGQLEAGGQMWKPEDLALRIIEEALHRAIRSLQKLGYADVLSMDELSDSSLNLGCSVAFDLDQRRLLSQIAQRLGFGRVSLSNIIEEPVAAGVGFAHLEGLRPGRTLIYDFGGGTFDAAVVDVDRDVTQVAVLGSSGVAYLGGDDIDQMIVEYFLDQIGDRYDLSRPEVASLLTSRIDERELRQRAEEAKIELSSAIETEATINLETFGIEKVVLDRDSLDGLLRHDRRFDGAALFERSEQCIRDVLRRAKAYDVRRATGGRLDKQAISNLSFEELAAGIDYVLMVGGVTKLPYVEARLALLFGNERLHRGYVLDDPVTAVVQGAALDKEYENLVLSAPPYSVLLKTERDLDGSETNYLYQAYSVLWPNRYSFSRSDIRYVSEPEWTDVSATICLQRHDSDTFDELYRVIPHQFVRIEIDLGAQVSVHVGNTIASMSCVHTCIAPWRHRVQVAVSSSPTYTGLIDNIESIMTEK